MLSKEEIEKAKEVCIKLIVYLPNFHLGGSEDIETLLQYIDQLEQENKTLKHTNKTYKGRLNKQNKIIDEMVEVINASSICDYFIKDNCKHYARKDKKLCDECIKQYFEKKVGN